MDSVPCGVRASGNAYVEIACEYLASCAEMNHFGLLANFARLMLLRSLGRVRGTYFHVQRVMALVFHFLLDEAR
jgi:hypothetical protein